MELTNKAMYIKGLADGLGLDAASKEGKVIAALLELVNEMAGTIEEMQSKMRDLEDYVEELDEDLGDVEEVLVGDGDEDEDEDDDDDGFCDGDCENCGENCADSDDDDEDDDEYFEVVCPSCGDVINFDSSIDPENLRCPNCGQKFECIVDEDDLRALDGDRRQRRQGVILFRKKGLLQFAASLFLVPCTALRPRHPCIKPFAALAIPAPGERTISNAAVACDG
ncbi:MAG: hypothetical protein L6V84_04815 [Oscillospiraceae bacterium]|nr:MAG: hypothetical protein L6V84_04815 [Oscillospiraceae bacterium]